MFYRECPYYKASQPRLQSRALIAALLSMLYWSLCLIHFVCFARWLYEALLLLSLAVTKRATVFINIVNLK